MDKLDQVLNGVDRLPPAPQLLPRLLSALADIDADLSQVVDIITFDPSLTAKLLQVCNSAVYAGVERVNNVTEAVNRLGLRTVYRIVATVMGTQSFQRSSTFSGPEAKLLWRHSVTSAFASQFIAEDVGADSGLLFTAGLLQEVGRVVLAQVFKEKCALPKPADQGPVTLEEEQAFYGVNHAELGGRLLQRWNFSHHLIKAVQFHHQPAAAGEDAPLAACVSLGDAVASGTAGHAPGQITSEAAPAMEILRLTVNHLPRYADRIRENLEYVEAMCRLQT